jgi:hypothetical protein
MRNVFFIVSVAVVLGACAKPNVEEAVKIDDTKLKTFKAACVSATSNPGYEKEAEDFKKFTIIRLEKTKTFESATECTPKSKGVLKIALNLRSFEGGSGALKAFTGGGDATVSFSGKLSDDVGGLGEFIGNATSQQRGGSFSVGGINVSGIGGMRDRALTNAADDVNKFINDRRKAK